MVAIAIITVGISKILLVAIIITASTNAAVRCSELIELSLTAASTNGTPPSFYIQLTVLCWKIPYRTDL